MISLSSPIKVVDSKTSHDAYAVFVQCPWRCGHCTSKRTKKEPLKSLVNIDIGWHRQAVTHVDCFPFKPRWPSQPQYARHWSSESLPDKELLSGFLSMTGIGSSISKAVFVTHIYTHTIAAVHIFKLIYKNSRTGKYSIDNVCVFGRPAWSFELSGPQNHVHQRCSRSTTVLEDLASAIRISSFGFCRMPAFLWGFTQRSWGPCRLPKCGNKWKWTV